MPSETGPVPSDIQLARLAAAGDVAAFTHLHRRHDARMRRVATAILHDDGEAEDAAQEAWIRAITHLGAVQEPGPWLRAVARNEALRMLARRARRATPVERVPDLPGPGSDCASLVQAAEAWRVVGASVAALDPPHREAVIRDLAGQRPVEAARAMRIAPGAARVRAHRARRRIAAALVASGMAA